MASRAIDALISYRIIKLLVTPFDRQEAFKYGIIDKDGKVLPQEPDALYSDKAKSARIFKRWRDVVTHDPKYISMRKMWRDYENHNLQTI